MLNMHLLITSKTGKVNKEMRKVKEDKVVLFKTSLGGDAWVAQLVKHPASAQVMISRFVGSGPVSGSVLIASSEPGACLYFIIIFLFFKNSLLSNWFPYNTQCSSPQVPSSITTTSFPFSPFPFSSFSAFNSLSSFASLSLPKE